MYISFVIYLLYNTNYNQNYISYNIKSIKHGRFKKKKKKKENIKRPLAYLQAVFKTEGFSVFFLVFLCVCSAGVLLRKGRQQRGNRVCRGSESHRGMDITELFLSGRWGLAYETWRGVRSRAHSGLPWCSFAPDKGCPLGGPGQTSASWTPAAGRLSVGSSAGACWPLSDPGFLWIHLDQRSD